ncbi:hypothetical protein RI844_11635 [Thalassotalea fonticola]|uniref:Alpha-L-arabinofuranosidase 1 catalytic domain-containing protein n=1 Tax=Thalassotalea fonticola TaxID=3065649 RepID=A0ABZ0GKC7_9GAMM|nr:hypothetical protein RI844_11635 [Colwelliaceae bacterium S1-1]
MFKYTPKLFIATASLLLSGILSGAHAKQTINIDYDDVLKTQMNAPIGENMNFLLSSDKKMPRSVSMKDRSKEMKLSILRFPYGRLADNYLFTDAPFNDGVNGLTPRVASIKQPPGDYYWAVDDAGYFKQALDFDEYMSYINELNVEPLIVVNMLSYDTKHYPETVVTFDDLKTHAKEWVKYANITRDYKVKYWQLGNEVASHTDKDSYFKHFVEMAKAMKAIDPNIRIGFGEDGRRNWLKFALADAEISKYIDFIAPHQYLHGKKWSESYQHWRDYSGTLTPKIDKFQHYANKSEHHQDVPIIVTEYGATGGHYPERDPKGLVFFKTLKTEQQSAGYLQLSNNGKHLTKRAQAAKLVQKSHAIDIELFADGWIGLKLNNNSDSYVKAQTKAVSPLTTDGSVDEDGTKWRLLELKKHQFYLQSKLHGNHYLTYNANNGLFTLADKEAAAEIFELKPYQPKRYFPRKQKRNISAMVNKKLLCVQADGSLKANLYRSESSSCQFVIKGAKTLGKNALTLQAIDADNGFISRNKDGSVSYTTTKQPGKNSAWALITRKNSFQLQAFDDKENYLKVNDNGVLTMGGKNFQKNATFTHHDIPEPEPKPLTTQPVGNFANDLWKSLVFADMTLSALRHKNISHMVHWNTHTSWEGKFGGYHNLANSLENNDDNTLTPVGQVLKLINNHTLSQILNIKTKHGFVRAFASFEPKTAEMSIILLNKNDSEEVVSLDLGRYQPTADVRHWLYTGSNPEDEYPTTQQVTNTEQGLITINQGKVVGKLPATSLTIIRLIDPSVSLNSVANTGS